MIMLNYLFYGLLLWIPISNFGSVTVANDEVNVIEKNTFQTHKKEGATQTQKSEERRHYNSSAVTKTRSEKPKMLRLFGNTNRIECGGCCACQYKRQGKKKIRLVGFWRVCCPVFDFCHCSHIFSSDCTLR
jgi:hypothetical protein